MKETCKDMIYVKWFGNNSKEYDGKEHFVPKKKLIEKEQDLKASDTVHIKWYGKVWKGTLLTNPNTIKEKKKAKGDKKKVTKPATKTEKKGKNAKSKTSIKTPKAKRKLFTPMKTMTKTKNSGLKVKQESLKSPKDKTPSTHQIISENELSTEMPHFAQTGEAASSKFYHTGERQIKLERNNKLTPGTPKFATKYLKCGLDMVTLNSFEDDTNHLLPSQEFTDKPDLFDESPLHMKTPPHSKTANGLLDEDLDNSSLMENKSYASPDTARQFGADEMHYKTTKMTKRPSSSQTSEPTFIDSYRKYGKLQTLEDDADLIPDTPEYILKKHRSSSNTANTSAFKGYKNDAPSCQERQSGFLNNAGSSVKQKSLKSPKDKTPNTHQIISENELSTEMPHFAQIGEAASSKSYHTGERQIKLEKNNKLTPGTPKFATKYLKCGLDMVTLNSFEDDTNHVLPSQEFTDKPDHFDESPLHMKTPPHSKTASGLLDEELDNSSLMKNKSYASLDTARQFCTDEMHYKTTKMTKGPSSSQTSEPTFIDSYRKYGKLQTLEDDADLIPDTPEYILKKHRRSSNTANTSAFKEYKNDAPSCQDRQSGFLKNETVYNFNPTSWDLSPNTIVKRQKRVESGPTYQCHSQANESTILTKTKNLNQQSKKVRYNT